MQANAGRRRGDKPTPNRTYLSPLSRRHAVSGYNGDMTDTMTTISAFDALDEPVRRRLGDCERMLREAGSVLVAFSAGVDSTFLLALATAVLGRQNVVAAMGISPSLPRRERDEGRRLAEQIGAERVEIETREMLNPDYASNPAERCFHCKDELFCRLGELAEQRRLGRIVSGANADDTGDFRPGLRAGRQRGVLTPLLDAGLTKADIRAASRAMGLPTAEKPAMACLASRVPYGRPITPETLARIERAEDALKDMGFAACRVRDHWPVARVELPAAELTAALQQREAIVAALKNAGYPFVTLDLAGLRTGSMNETL